MSGICRFEVSIKKSQADDFCSIAILQNDYYNKLQ